MTVWKTIREKTANCSQTNTPTLLKRIRGQKKAVDALTRRINEMIVEMPDNLTLEEKTDIARNNLKIEKALRRYQR